MEAEETSSCGYVVGGVTPNHAQRTKILPGSFAASLETTSNTPSRVAPLYFPPVTSIAETLCTCLVRMIFALLLDSYVSTLRIYLSHY